MDLSFLIKGFLLGLSIAAPVGPIGVLCIRRSLHQGMPVGFATGLGAATADAFYGAIAAFGLTLISGALLTMSFPLQISGGFVLWYLGVKAFRTPPAPEQGNAPPVELWKAYFLTIFLTLANPATIIAFIATFVGLGLGSKAANYTSATHMTLGVFLGSAAWWLVLSGLIGLARVRMTPKLKRTIDQLSGVTLILFGLYAIYRAFTAPGS